jgi:16S rRNA processing protein RimM
MVPEGWLTLATVLKPRGNKGEVIVDLLTSSIDRLREVPGVSVFAAPGLTPREFTIDNAWLHQDKAVVKLSGLDSISEAETLSGADLCIPLSQRRAPRPGEVFFSDLIGCRIFDKANLLLGSVRDILELGDLVWLVLDPGDVLIPWVPAFFPVQDFAQKRLVADLPEGLLEVNQP